MGQLTNDPRFVSPEDLPETRAVSRKRYEDRKRERDMEQARASMRAWIDED